MKIGISLPPATTALVDADGLIEQAWYQPLLAFFNRTGGAAGISSSDVQSTANSASSTAVVATNTASAATVTANSATTAAATAQATATEALIAAIAAKAEAVIKAEFSLPISFFFPGSPLGTVYVPIVQPLILPANFQGMALYCGSPCSSEVMFELDLIRGGGTTAIGTITLADGNPTSRSVSGSPAVALQGGDVLALFAAIGATDISLANVAVSFPLQLA